MHPPNTAQEHESTLAPFLPGSYPSPSSSPGPAPQRSLPRAVYERRSEYTKTETTRIKVGTWNVAALPHTEHDLAAWFVQSKGVATSLAELNLGPSEHSTRRSHPTKESVEDQEARQGASRSTIPLGDHSVVPDDDNVALYVLGLQEVVDISSPTEVLKPYVDPQPSTKWKRALQEALPKGYALVAEQQLSGLLLLLYASPQLQGSVSSVSTTFVGTGLMGYMGNKGAAVVRIVIGGMTRLVFVNAHLAAGADRASLDRRNWDAAQVLARTKLSPVEGEFESRKDETIGDEDFAFWFGDLNYRLDDIPGDDVRRLLLRHTRGVYQEAESSLTKINDELGYPSDSIPEAQRREASKSTLAAGIEAVASAMNPHSKSGDQDPESDPDSLQNTLSSLLPHDQLRDQMHRRRAFHEGWQEGPIKFLPTYKYDVGSVGMFDSSEKRRSPSWCDRILYRSRHQYQEYLDRIKTEEEARVRDRQMEARGLGGDDVLFDYNPETDGAEEDYNEYESNGEMLGKELDKAVDNPQDNSIRQEYYISHQRVLSSDHKPISAVFSLQYHSVDVDLRSKISLEVAKELDKVENEARPGITIDVERAKDTEGEDDSSLDYGNVRYAVPNHRMITVANTSQVRTTFAFHGEDNASKKPYRWLTIQRECTDGENDGAEVPTEYTMDPGDTVNVKIVLKVDHIQDVRQLNAGKARLEDVLVLRVKDGRDHFLPVHGWWLRTCFGMSLNVLSANPDGNVRRAHQDKAPDGEPIRYSAPRQLFRLAEALEAVLERAVADWDMTGQQAEPPWDKVGWPFAQHTWLFDGGHREAASAMVRESLDTGDSFAYQEDLKSYERAEVLAEVMVRFVNAIEGGIIGDTVWKDLVHALTESAKAKEEMDNAEKRALVLEILSAYPMSSVSFTYVTFSLARVLDEVAPRRLVASPPATPRSADGLLRRARGLTNDPVVTKRKEAAQAFASLFVQALFKADLPTRAKDRRSDIERRKDVVLPFIEGDGDIQ